MVDLPEDPTSDLPPLPVRQQIVNVDRTATTAFIRWLDQWLKRAKAVGDGLIDGDIPAGDVTPGSIDIEDLVDQFRREVGVLVGYDGAPIHGRIKQLRDQVEQLANSVAALGGVTSYWNNRVEAKFSGFNALLGKTVSSSASVEQQLLALATADQAFAQSLLTLEADFTTDINAVTAAVAAESTARSNADGALATDITDLAASYNDVSANGFARFEVAATAAGATASYQVALRAVAAGVTYDGGMRLDLMPTGYVRAFFNVDELIVGNASVTSAPFSVSGGAVRISNAYIVNLTATNITFKGLNGDDVLVDSSVITDLLADNAAMKAAAVYSATMVTPITSETTVQTLAFTPDAGKVFIKANLFLSVSGASSVSADIRIRKSGTQVAIQRVVVDLGTPQQFPIFHEDTSPSSATWTVTVERASASGLYRSEYNYLECVNYKKQA